MTPGLALESGEFIPAHELNAHVQKPPEIEHKGVVMSKSDQEMNTGGFDAAVQGAPVAEKPYAYAVYFPDQPTEELVHDLDELCEDLTNREHSIIELYERKGAAQAGVPAGHAKALLEKVDAIIGCINEAHHSQGSGWKQGCFMAADNAYEELKVMLAAAPQPSPSPAPAQPGQEGLTDLLRQIVSASDDGDSDTHLSPHFYKRIMSHIETPAVRPVTPLTCPKCNALWLHWPAEQTGFGEDTLNCRSAQHCDYCEKAGVEQLQRLERVPVTSAARAAPQPATADAEIEALAVEHEAFGFGRADKQGLSTHGFDPDGLRDFARAVLAKWGHPLAVAGGEPVATVIARNGIEAEFTCEMTHGHVPEIGADVYLAPPPQAVREPLSTIDLMRVVMDADNETRGFALRGTTNWAAHIGKAVQNAVLGITKGDTNAPSN